jgi:hypothetical protein
MKQATLRCALLLGATLCTSPFARAQTLTDLWNDEQVMGLRIEPTLAPGLESLSHRTVLWTSGFLNGFIPHYFVDNSDVAVNELGMKSMTYAPPSDQDVPVTAELIASKAYDSYYRGEKQPLILVGHSKGAAETLDAVLSHPDLMVNGIVEKVILIDGAINGSPVATGVMSQPELRLFSKPIRDGLIALEPVKMRTLFNGKIAALKAKLTPDQYADFSGRIFYVRGHSTDAGTAPVIKLTHSYLDHQGSGDNDGLVLVEDQKRDDIGVDLGVMDTDHGGLTCGQPMTYVTGEQRKAFTRALFEILYE